MLWDIHTRRRWLLLRSDSLSQTLAEKDEFESKQKKLLTRRQAPAFQTAQKTSDVPQANVSDTAMDIPVLQQRSTLTLQTDTSAVARLSTRQLQFNTRFAPIRWMSQWRKSWKKARRWYSQHFKSESKGVSWRTSSTSTCGNRRRELAKSRSSLHKCSPSTRLSTCSLQFGTMFPRFREDRKWSSSSPVRRKTCPWSCKDRSTQFKAQRRRLKYRKCVSSMTQASTIQAHSKQPKRQWRR